MTINVDDIETEIIQAKNQIRSAGGDLKQGFAALDPLIDEQIAEIEQIVADGGSPIPVTSLAELDTRDEAFHDLVRRRGCCRRPFTQPLRRLRRGRAFGRRLVAGPR